MANEDRNLIIYRASLAEQAERYEEMVEEMKKVAMMDVELSVSERNLLSVAYKNVIGAKRSSLRVLCGMEVKQESKGESARLKLIQDMKTKVQDEIGAICNDILSLLEDHLLPKVTGDDEEKQESRVFYLKMKGDYYRYLAEYTVKEEREANAEKSLTEYGRAKEIADLKLVPLNPIRLGLALNFSVFFYEILGKPEKACSTAKSAFDEAMATLDECGAESYKDSTLIMQLLRDNLTLWMSDENDLEQEDA